MNIGDVKQQIKTGKFDRFYIFYGDEHYILKQYIDMIAKKANLKKMYIDNLGSVFAKISQKSLIKEHFLYVIMDDREFLTSEKAWSALGDGRQLKDDIVIFYYTSTDKRVKFWKNYKDRAVEFAPLSEEILVKYMQKQVSSLTEENCRHLMEICKNDYSRIRLELDKVRQMYENIKDELVEGADENGVLEILIKEGVIYKEPKDAIFDFVGAVLERDTTKAFDLLEQSYAVGEVNMVLLSVLYTNIRTLFMIQASKSTKGLGLNGWVIKNTMQYKDNYTNNELAKALRLIRRAEKGIKTGEITDDMSVQSILVQIM